MWSIITHLIAFTAGTVAGVVLLCLMQAGKMADDFFVRISGFTSSPAEKQSRSFTNLEITGFSNSVLTLKGTYTQYDYHANSLYLTVEIYVYK